MNTQTVKNNVKTSSLFSFILVASTLLILSTANASIVCKKDGGRWYPANEKAVQIAKMLGVKTCTGKRFKAVVAKLGETSNVVAGKKNMSVDDVIAQLKK